jgi:hypothetical protein
MSTAPPVISKVSFKDEGRDVLADVLKDPGKQALSGDTGTYFQPVAETPAEAPPPPVLTTETAPPPPPTLSTSTAPPVPEKLFAGKFKTVEDMEKSYVEIEKAHTTKAQEAAAAKKALEAAEAVRLAAPENVAAQNEEQRLKLINDFLTDPTKTVTEIESRVKQSMAQTAEVSEKMNAHWEANKDMAPYKKYIGVDYAELVQANPDVDPWAALQEATTRMRAYYGAILDQGRKEALSNVGAATQLSAKVNTPPPTEQPPQAPKTDEQQRTEHLTFLQSQAAGVRRPVR